MTLRCCWSGSASLLADCSSSTGCTTTTTAVIQPLIDSGQAIVCYSLSKAFLSPLLMGMTVVPPRLASSLQKPPRRPGIGPRCLPTKYKVIFPRRQQDIFRYRWNRLRDVCDLAAAL